MLLAKYSPADGPEPRETPAIARDFVNFLSQRLVQKCQVYADEKICSDEKINKYK